MSKNVSNEKGDEAMNKNYFNHMLVLISAILFAMYGVLIAGEPAVSNDYAQKAAYSYARQLWGEVQVGKGIIFVDPTDQPVVYMFPIHIGQGVFPAEETIMAQVQSARAYRLQGDELIKQGQEKNDLALIEKGYQMVEEGWKKMRDEEHFGTVIISALHKKHPGVEMYRGLPLNYVSLADAREAANNALAAGSSVLKRYIFWGLFDLAAEFEAGGKTVLINLQTHESIDTNTQATEVRSDWFIHHVHHAEAKSFDDIALFKPLEPEPPWEVSLDGVPDYDNEYSRGCAVAAAGCVLGYQDGEGWDRLIDGGDKYYRGYRVWQPVGGEGYLHTLWDQLGPAMGYVVGQGVVVKPYCAIWTGIREVCNNSLYGNNYNFSVSHLSWSYDPATHYNTVKTEIRYGRPMVYTLCYPTYGGGSGYHSVTLIGYGCLLPPEEELLNKASLSNQLESQQAFAENYEHCYICHDNNESTGENVYLWWSEFIGDSHIDRVRPGGTSQSAMQNLAKNFSCWNSPNPFNPATEIFYTIDTKAPVVIKIFDITGQIICTFNEGLKEPGLYSVYWNGRDNSGALVAAGIYFYKVQAGGRNKVSKMTLLR